MVPRGPHPVNAAALGGQLCCGRWTARPPRRDSSIAPNPGGTMAEVLEVTDQNFEEVVLKSKTPAIIDFWAEWCAPCRAIAPIIKDLAARYGDQVKIVKMNIDENPGTPGTYGVRAIPTVLAFRSGAVVEQITGAKPKKSFEEMVEKLLG
jgi:thioredoxin 1